MPITKEPSGHIAATEDAAPPQAWSAPATSRCVLELLDELDWKKAKMADVGAGRGHFSQVLGEGLRTRYGLDPREHVFPCDLIPESFEYTALECQATGKGGRLPFEDDSLDAAISIEVIEHVENQFEFLRELMRVVKPGGLVVVTTPNTLNANSRVRALTWGFPLLFDPLPLDEHDPRLCGGHIHPISPYFLAYNALRAGLVDPTFHPDRAKSSAVGWTILIAPFLLVGRLKNTLRLKLKWPDTLRENSALVAAQCGWGLLTSRTAVLSARKPGPQSGP